jgi:hypothetical protein
VIRDKMRRRNIKDEEYFDRELWKAKKKKERKKCMSSVEENCVF